MKKFQFVGLRKSLESSGARRAVRGWLSMSCKARVQADLCGKGKIEVFLNLKRWK